MDFKVTVDSNLCIGCGHCSGVSPIFMIKDDKVYLRGLKPEDHQERFVTDPEYELIAARTCPSHAIHVFDGNEQII